MSNTSGTWPTKAELMARKAGDRPATEHLTRANHLRGLPGFAIAAFIAGFFSMTIFYEADVFWQDTGFVFGVSLVACVWGFWRTRKGRLHPMYLRGNAAIGAARLGVIVSLLWCGYVLIRHADPTITGLWTVLYAVMALAAIKVFGQFGAEYFGPRLRIDIYERGNLAAGTFVGAFTLATGLIFGGAMWGEMEPESLAYGWLFRFLPGYEDGWWITPWFFGMGWLILFFSLRFWFRREQLDPRQRLARERNLDDAWAAGCFAISIAIPITYAVHGDYLGFWESLIGFSVIALPILAHEILRPATPGTRRQRGEGLIYIAMSLAGIAILPALGRLIGLGG